MYNKYAQPSRSMLSPPFSLLQIYAQMYTTKVSTNIYTKIYTNMLNQTDLCVHLPSLCPRLHCSLCPHHHTRYLCHHDYHDNCYQCDYHDDCHDNLFVANAYYRWR